MPTQISSRSVRLAFARGTSGSTLVVVIVLLSTLVAMGSARRPNDTDISAWASELAP